jgi:hypothetical protein
MQEKKEQVRPKKCQEHGGPRRKSSLFKKTEGKGEIHISVQGPQKNYSSTTFTLVSQQPTGRKESGAG